MSASRTLVIILSLCFSTQLTTSTPGADGGDSDATTSLRIVGEVQLPTLAEIESIAADTYNLESWNRKPLLNVRVPESKFDEVMSFFRRPKPKDLFDTSLTQIGTLKITLKTGEILTITWFDYGKGTNVFSAKGIPLFSTDRQDKGAPGLILDSILRDIK